MWGTLLKVFGWGTASPAARGAQLLKENLSPEQRRQYRMSGHFDVVGGDSRKKYRIYRARFMNIAELNGAGRCVATWCFLPEGNLVRTDNMLAQKLALELFETDALAGANKFPPEKVNAF